MPNLKIRWLSSEFQGNSDPIIARPAHIAAIQRRLRNFPVVALLGARQIGKTTLAEQVVTGYRQPVHRFDLEDPRDLARLDDPMLALVDLKGLIILDEVQRRPDLFPVLRVLVDREPKPARFLVLGSASPDLLKQSSETRAGRIDYYELPGLSLAEVRVNQLQDSGCAVDFLPRFWRDRMRIVAFGETVLSRRFSSAIFRNSVFVSRLRHSDDSGRCSLIGMRSPGMHSSSDVPSELQTIPYTTIWIFSLQHSSFVSSSPGMPTFRNAKSSHQRSTFATVGCCMRCSA